MSSDVPKARGRKKAPRREKNGEESSSKIPRGLRSRGACGSAAKAPAKETPPATQATSKRSGPGCFDKEGMQNGNRFTVGSSKG